jgi:putative sterol carrier protein
MSDASPSQPHAFFSDAWVAAWIDEIQGSESYRQAASAWEGSLIFRLGTASAGPSGENRAVFLDLWHGECRLGRLATAEDIMEASYIIEADLPVWKGLLQGKAQPLMALMTGKLRLKRGNLSALMPHVQASQELVAAASRVPTDFSQVSI